MKTTITLPGQRNSAGEVVREELDAVALDDGSFRLTVSPGAVEGLAAGDVVRLDGDGPFELVRRSGNLCIWVLPGKGDEESCARELGPRVEALGGFLDGGNIGMLIFTVPIAAGFTAVERVLDAHVAEHDGTEWYFGNVYDPRDGVTPLYWW